MKRRIFTSLAATAAVAASILISSGAAEAAPEATPSLSATNSSAQTGGVTPNESLPDGIKVKPEENLKIVATFRGVGKQVYDCDATTKTYPAKSREPVAGLFTSRGIPVGIHGKGPFWADFDGSHVDGSAPIAADSTDKLKNVPWLRLTGTPTAGTGVLSNVVVIQRIDTRGGVAPTGTCTASSTVAVDYTANYVFWAKK